ncbi:MAG: helix-turn-helix domain-containing protein [Clostridiales bacterium]|nr:helix-turn-helix domain-containing protein [Clostridiales bacterium]
MAVNYEKLGDRISYLRTRQGISQEELTEEIALSREHISRIEGGKKKPGLDTIVDIANILGVSADDLLVDSLEHPASTADSEIHHLLLDCNPLEEKILTRTLKELKEILYGLGV